jgi:hypothetical protein
MVENAAILISVLKRAHASRFKKYQEKLEREKAERWKRNGVVKVAAVTDSE